VLGALSAWSVVIRLRTTSRVVVSLLILGKASIVGIVSVLDGDSATETNFGIQTCTGRVSGDILFQTRRSQRAMTEEPFQQSLFDN
jgi:hypothetical protein